jgi:hypothetical protein
MDGTFSPLGRQIFLEVATAMTKTGLGILYHQGYQATKMIQLNPLSSSLLSLKMAA